MIFWTDVIRKGDADLRQEGLMKQIPIKNRISQGTIAKNALLSVTHTTPYNAVYGRVPDILPSMDYSGIPMDDRNLEQVAMPGVVKHINRLRKIFVRAMVQSTAIEDE